jgi:hypothetical protein
MMHPGDRWSRIVAVVVLGLGLAGCGGGGSAAKTTVADYSKIRAMGVVYSAYLEEHAGQPPQGEQEFRDYLSGKQELLDRTSLSVDEMFTSPRGKPLTWVYGQPPPRGSAGMTYFGYETEPVDGKRLVIAGRGMYEEMDDAQFRKVFPEAS